MKWSVRKRDGAWIVRDGRGKLRYASSEYRMALSFALVRGMSKSVFRPVTLEDIQRLSEYRAIGESWKDVMRRVWKNGEEDEQ